LTKETVAPPRNRLRRQSRRKDSALSADFEGGAVAELSVVVTKHEHMTTRARLPEQRAGSAADLHVVQDEPQIGTGAVGFEGDALAVGGDFGVERDDRA